jgi:hypothetical protein
VGECGWVGGGGKEEGTIKDSYREGLELKFNGQREGERYRVMIKGM